MGRVGGQPDTPTDREVRDWSSMCRIDFVHKMGGGNLSAEMKFLNLSYIQFFYDKNVGISFFSENLGGDFVKSTWFFEIYSRISENSIV